MTEVNTESELGASADDVWTLVGDFGGFVEALGAPVTVEGPEGVGQLRNIEMGGATTVERVESLDPATRTISYSVQAGPLPVQDYLATMQVHEAGADRSKVTWGARFEPAGMPEDDAKNLITAIFQGGLTALQGRFGS